MIIRLLSSLIADSSAMCSYREQLAPESDCVFTSHASLSQLRERERKLKEYFIHYRVLYMVIRPFLQALSRYKFYILVASFNGILVKEQTLL